MSKWDGCALVCLIKVFFVPFCFLFPAGLDPHLMAVRLGRRSVAAAAEREVSVDFRRSWLWRSKADVLESAVALTEEAQSADPKVLAEIIWFAPATWRTSGCVRVSGMSFRRAGIQGAREHSRWAPLSVSICRTSLYALASSRRGLTAHAHPCVFKRVFDLVVETEVDDAMLSLWSS